MTERARGANLVKGGLNQRRTLPMAEPQIRFDDGASYEQMMGIWSRLTGEIFLDWLAPPLGLRWIDIGCGNGAFTELLVERCPSEVQGVDPSEGQLAFARKRPASRLAKFCKGDAMALPFPAGSFDAAIMALVLVFVPDPAKGVDEMVRVVGPGGTIATYMWDMLGGGFPLDPIILEMRAMGFAPPRPPRMDASRMEVLRDLWMVAGFDDLWMINLKAPSLGPTVAAMESGEVETLKTRVRARLPEDTEGRITYGARAHAIKG